MEQHWAEPLHEYAQFAEIIKKLLVYRHQKHVQFEMTKAALENKKEIMDDFERSEAEAQRLQSALSGSVTASRVGPPGGSSLLSGEVNENAVANQQAMNRSNTTGSSYSSPTRRKSSSGGGLLSAISYSIQGIMDVDPETARRNSMSKTKESISQVCNSSSFCIAN
jgi:sorting nexin-4